jgi:polyisoprenoid-binding protein YceI
VTTTAPTPTSPTPARSRRKRWPYVVGAAVLLVALAAGAIWYFIFRGDSPAPVDIDTATESAEEEAGQAPSSLDGTWRVDQLIGTFDDFTSAFAGYRVQEELVGIGAQTAVGRTPNVTGTLEIEGTEISTTDITVDMTTLTSDEDRRDGALTSQAIETATFPTATFVLTKPIELDEIPEEGVPITADATGDLTLHGVTNRVTIPIQGQVDGDVITVTGSTEIAFADYGIGQPTSGAVLSVEDHGIFELQLFFTKQR